MTFRLEFNSDLPAFPPILSKETIFKIPEYPLIYSVLVIRQKTMMCPSISWSTTYLKILWERKVLNYGKKIMAYMGMLMIIGGVFMLIYTQFDYYKDCSGGSQLSFNICGQTNDT